MSGSGWWGRSTELLDRLEVAAESLNLPAIHKQHHCRTNTLQLHNTQEILRPNQKGIMQPLPRCAPRNPAPPPPIPKPHLALM